MVFTMSDVLLGADVGGTSYQGQTILHKLFCSTDENVPCVMEKTKLFLALGTVLSLFFV